MVAEFLFLGIHIPPAFCHALSTTYFSHATVIHFQSFFRMPGLFFGQFVWDSVGPWGQCCSCLLNSVDYQPPCREFCLHLVLGWVNLWHVIRNWAPFGSLQYTAFWQLRCTRIFKISSVSTEVCKVRGGGDVWFNSEATYLFLYLSYILLISCLDKTSSTTWIDWLVDRLIK